MRGQCQRQYLWWKSRGDGVDDSTIVGGAGDDRIVVTTAVGANQIPSGFESLVSGLSESSISGGHGNDFISVAATVADRGFADDNSSYGLRQSSIRGEGGDDLILVESGTVSAAYRSSLDSVAYGVSDGRVTGGIGKDKIEIMASAEVFGDSGGVTSATVASGSRVGGWDGADRIMMTAIAKIDVISFTGDSLAYGVETTTVSGDNR